MSYRQWFSPDRWASLEGAWTAVAVATVGYEARVLSRAYKELQSVDAASASTFAPEHRVTAARAELLRLQATVNLTNALADTAVQTGFLIAGLAALSTPRLEGPQTPRNTAVGLVLLGCEAALLVKSYTNHAANKRIRARLLERRRVEREKEVPHG